MTKIEAVYLDEYNKLPEDQKGDARKNAVARVIAEGLTTKNGAGTLVSNAKKKFHPESVVAKAVKAVGAIEQIVKGDSNEIFSMVTVDKFKKAVDVKCFVTKETCLEECNRLNKHFVRGLQKRGAPLNTIDKDWVAELDKPFQVEYLEVMA